MLGAPSQPETSNSPVSSTYRDGEGMRRGDKTEIESAGTRGRKGGCVYVACVSPRVYDNRTLEVSLRETLGQVSLH